MQWECTWNGVNSEMHENSNFGFIIPFWQWSRVYAIPSRFIFLIWAFNCESMNSTSDQNGRRYQKCNNNGLIHFNLLSLFHVAQNNEENCNWTKHLFRFAYWNLIYDVNPLSFSTFFVYLPLYKNSKKISFLFHLLINTLKKITQYRFFS